MAYYKVKRLKQIRSQIEDVDHQLNRTHSMVNSFVVIADRARHMMESAEKMKGQYMTKHRHAAMELDNLFIEIEEMEKEATKYTKEEVNQILLRKDGKMNDWINSKRSL